MIIRVRRLGTAFLSAAIAALSLAANADQCTTYVQYVGGNWHYGCQNPCTPGCSIIDQEFQWGVMKTCSCAGAQPICCHLGWVRTPSGLDVDATGACSNGYSCPDGDYCDLEVSWLNEYDFEVLPECLDY